MLKELLEKRAKNEDLTEEELNILKDYDDSIAVQMSELKALKTEREANTTKYSNLEETIKELTKNLELRDSDLKKVSDEKKSIEEILKNTETTQKALLEIERQKVEKENKDRLEAERLAKEKAEQDRLEQINSITKAKEELENKVKLMEFKFRMNTEKMEKPYLANQIDSIIKEVDVRGVDSSETIYSFLINSMNHDEEMEKYNIKKNQGSSIFDNKDKGKEEKVETNVLNDESKVLDFAKKLGFKVKK